MKRSERAPRKNQPTVHAARSFSLGEGRLLSAPVATSERDYRLRIELPYYRSWEPGQFVMLRWEPHVIGRPFAIVDWRKTPTGSVMEVWIRRLGAGTEELFAKGEKGARIHVTAPLGRGLPKELLSPRASLLVISGGVGAASVLPLVAAREQGLASKAPKSAPLAGLDVWVHGERSLSHMDSKLLASSSKLRPDLLCLEDKASGAALKKLPRSMTVSQGRVTEVLEQVAGQSFTAAVVCGPTPMLKAVSDEFAKRETLARLPLYLGLEEKMGCGIGLCFSCSVMTERGPERCCLEGPWFLAKDIGDHYRFRKEGG
jgi:dihydroorotate dehydrogenase electron transfer subunit